MPTNGWIIGLFAAVGLVAAGSEVMAQDANPATEDRALRVFANASGSGTANQLSKWIDDSGTLGNSGISEVNGLIGIGTSSPTGRLHVYGEANWDVFAGFGVDVATGPAFNIGYSGSSFGRGSGFFNVRPDSLAVPPNPSLRFMTANVTRVIITNIGRVGVGTLNPLYLLDVNGGGHFTGDLVVDGNLAAKYQDLAEWVPAAHDMAPGTVVVLNPNAVNEVMPSSRAYDTTVAGVVSAQPGIVLGVGSDSKEQIATTGRVKVRVDATQAPIRVGDLLVTSEVPGAAMRSEPVQIHGQPFHHPGTIVGKALEPLEQGTGAILVLLSLQ